MLRCGVAAFVAAVLLPACAEAVTLGFDDLAGGTAVGAQYAGVTFALKNGGLPTVYSNADYARSGANTLINRADGGVADHLQVRFGNAVNNLRFFYSAEDRDFDVRIFHAGGVSELNFAFDDDAKDIDRVDLSQFQSVTSFVILEKSLGDGKRDSIVIDDLRFVPETPPPVTTPVPLPAAGPMLAGGIGAIAWLGRRRSRKIRRADG